MIELLAIITAITALCSVLLGPLITMWAANKQARISLRSNNRQAWINKLRDVLAEFSSAVRMATLTKTFDDRYAKAEKILFLEHQAKLLVNPNEADHKRLLDEMDKAKSAAINIFSDKNDKEMIDTHHKTLKDSIDSLTTISQLVLKREWERVKKAD